MARMSNGFSHFPRPEKGFPALLQGPWKEMRQMRERLGFKKNFEMRL